MNIGDIAPDLLGVDQNGAQVMLSSLPGRKVALYFYPKDNTSGCTAQACSLRDGYAELRAEGYEIIGVSVDSEASHRKFIDKQQLPFTLVADTDHRLVELFGVWAAKKLYGREYMGTMRTTFIIDADSRKIERIISPKEVSTKAHAEQILAH